METEKEMNLWHLQEEEADLFKVPSKNFLKKPRKQAQ